jgi:hypothetical protein
MHFDLRNSRNQQLLLENVSTLNLLRNSLFQEIKNCHKKRSFVNNFTNKKLKTDFSEIKIENES